jgi:hypothetical protein
LSGKRSKILWRVGERDATVTDRVIMSTFEMLVSVSEQQRARSHKFAPNAGTVLKTSLHHDRDSDVFVLLFK